MAQASTTVKPSSTSEGLTDEEIQKLREQRDREQVTALPTSPQGTSPSDLLQRGLGSFAERAKQTWGGLKELGGNVYDLMVPSSQPGQTPLDYGGPFVPSGSQRQAAANIFRGVAEPMVDLRKQAGTAWQQGRPVEAFVKGGLSNVPLAGPWAVDLANQFGKGAPEGLGAASFDAVQTLLGNKIGSGLRKGGAGLKEWAKTSMGRAIDPTGGMSKYTAPQVIDNLLKEHKRFWTIKELEQWSKRKMEQAMADKAEARATMPADASIPGADVEAAFNRKAVDYFNPITETPSGIPTTAMGADAKALAELNALKQRLVDSLDPNNPTATANRAARGTGSRLNIEELPPEVQAAIAEQLGDTAAPAQAAVVPSIPVAFDLLEQFKQEWQNYAKRHGKFTGKRTYGMTLESSPVVEAADAASAAIRELLNKAAPDEWVNANRMFHDMKQIFDLALERKLANMGVEVPLSETMVGGLGAGGYVKGQSPALLKGAEMRGVRRLRRTPGWHSNIAVFKDISGDILGNVGEMDKANQALMLLQRGSPAGFKGSVRTDQAAPTPSWMQSPGTEPNKTGHVYWENGRWVEK